MGRALESRTGYLYTLPGLDEGHKKRSGIWECQTQGASVGQESLCGPPCPGVGKMLTPSTSAPYSAALPLTSLGPLPFPAWQLQRNREGTAEQQFRASFRHPPPWALCVEPALHPRCQVSCGAIIGLFQTQLASCLTSQETARTRSLFPPPPHCCRKEALTC